MKNQIISRSTSARGATVVELFLKVFQLFTMVAWFFVIKKVVEWPFIWMALLSIVAGFISTWLLALIISRVSSKTSRR